MPIIALILLLGGGSALAKTCHIDIAATVQTHIHGTNDHVNQVDKNLNTKLQDLPYEICFLIGFVALVIIRVFKLRWSSNPFKFLDFARQRTFFQSSQVLSYLSPTHLKLNIIRI